MGTPSDSEATPPKTLLKTNTSLESEWLPNVGRLAPRGQETMLSNLNHTGRERSAPDARGNPLRPDEETADLVAVSRDITISLFRKDSPAPILLIARRHASVELDLGLPLLARTVREALEHPKASTETVLAALQNYLRSVPSMLRPTSRFRSAKHTQRIIKDGDRGTLIRRISSPETSVADFLSGTRATAVTLSERKKDGTELILLSLRMDLNRVGSGIARITLYRNNRAHQFKTCGDHVAKDVWSLVEVASEQGTAKALRHLRENSQAFTREADELLLPSLGMGRRVFFPTRRISERGNGRDLRQLWEMLGGNVVPEVVRGRVCCENATALLMTNRRASSFLITCDDESESKCRGWVCIPNLHSFDGYDSARFDGWVEARQRSAGLIFKHLATGQLFDRRVLFHLLENSHGALVVIEPDINSKPAPTEEICSTGEKYGLKLASLRSLPRSHILAMLWRGTRPVVFERGPEDAAGYFPHLCVWHNDRQPVALEFRNGQTQGITISLGSRDIDEVSGRVTPRQVLEMFSEDPWSAIAEFAGSQRTRLIRKALESLDDHSKGLPVEFLIDRAGILSVVARPTTCTELVMRVGSGLEVLDGRCFHARPLTGLLADAHNLKRSLLGRPPDQFRRVSFMLGEQRDYLKRFDARSLLFALLRSSREREPLEPLKAELAQYGVPIKCPPPEWFR